jgi:hypothetical protein
MRDQLSTRICFRVARGEISRIGVYRSGAENLRYAGRALILDGLLQAYYFDKQRLIDLARDAMSTSDAPLAFEQPLTIKPRTPTFTPDEIKMVEAAQAADGWFRIRGEDNIPSATGIARERIEEIAKRWVNAGYLTSVIYEGGVRKGRRITDRLLEAAGL